MAAGLWLVRAKRPRQIDPGGWSHWRLAQGTLRWAEALCPVASGGVKRVLLINTLRAPHQVPHFSHHLPDVPPTLSALCRALTDYSIHIGPKFLCPIGPSHTKHTSSNFSPTSPAREPARKPTTGRVPALRPHRFGQRPISWTPNLQVPCIAPCSARRRVQIQPKMYLPRELISKLYVHLQKTRHPLSPPVLILVALEPDALCACRIFTRLLKHDYIPHKIHPVAGYGDLERAGQELVAPMMETRGGSGGVVVCLGVGGMVDMGTILGLEVEGEESSFNGVEVWLFDSHRPWNLSNVFGGYPLEPEHEGAKSSYQARAPEGVAAGRVERAYKPGKGGIIVFDDGDVVESLDAERDAYLALVDMPDIDAEDGDLYGDSDSESEEEREEPKPRAGQKRKSWSDRGEESSDEEDDRPRQRRRSNSVSRLGLPWRDNSADIDGSQPLLLIHRDALHNVG